MVLISHQVKVMILQKMPRGQRGHILEWLGGHVEHRGVPFLISDSHTHTHTHTPHLHRVVTQGANKFYCFKPVRFGVISDRQF